MLESSLNKKRIAVTLSLALLTMNNLYANDQILERQVLSNPGFNFIDVHSMNLFIDDDNNVFVLAAVWRTDSTKDFLYINNNWKRVDKYGILLNGFIKGGYFHLTFRKDQDVVIYNIQNDIKFTSRIEGHIRIGGIDRNIGSYQNRVIPVPGQNSSYYFLGSYVKLPANPLQCLRTIISGGHGIYYEKPVLAEIHNDKMLKSRKIRYGGKIDETFIIKEVTKGKDSIHFLGLRGPETPETSGPPSFAPNKSVILHYVDYNFKRKKTTRKYSIFENTSKHDKNSDIYFDYGSFSIDNLDDDVFVVFSLVETHRSNDNIKSDIYYSQSNDNSFTDLEKIGNGFSVLVRADFLGNVHVFWISSNGGLAHKVKTNGRWSDEKFISNNVDLYSGIISTRYIAAEFDKENNLHVVYPSGGNLVHTVVRLN